MPRYPTPLAYSSKIVAKIDCGRVFGRPGLRKERVLTAIPNINDPKEGNKQAAHQESGPFHLRLAIAFAQATMMLQLTRASSLSSGSFRSP